MPASEGAGMAAFNEDFFQGKVAGVPRKPGTELTQCHHVAPCLLRETGRGLWLLLFSLQTEPLGASQALWPALGGRPGTAAHTV